MIDARLCGSGNRSAYRNKIDRAKLFPFGWTGMGDANELDESFGGLDFIHERGLLQGIPFNWRATGWELPLRTFPYKSAHAVIALRKQRDQTAPDITSAAGNENGLAARCPIFAGLLPPRGFLFRGVFGSG